MDIEKKIDIITSQVNCSRKRARNILKKNDNNIDDAIFCIMSGKETVEAEIIDDSHLTLSQKKFKELRGILDVKDAYFCKIMDSIRTQKQPTTTKNQQNIKE